jgi:hypothetical protein
MTAQLTRPLTTRLEKLINHSPLQTHPLEGVREPVVFEKGERVFKFWNKKILFTDDTGLTFTVYQRDDIFPKSEENKCRMASGKPPLGSDGKEIELHHLTQTYGGPLAEVTRRIHRDGKLKNGNSYEKILHGCPPEKLLDIYERWARILAGSLPDNKTERKQDWYLWLEKLLSKDLKLNPTTFNPASKNRKAFGEQKEAYWMERGKKLFGVDDYV